MQNPKTTIMGVLIIIATLADAAVSYLKTGQIPDIKTLIAGLATGWGFVKAADSAEKPANQNPVGKILPLLLVALFFTGCAVDASGNRRYVGPSVGVNLGYRGVDLGFRLYGEPVPLVATAVLPLQSGTATVAVGQPVELPLLLK